MLQEWGCKEVILTQSSGILCRSGEQTLFAAFSNRNSLGRNGRGDTTFAACLSRRLTHSASEATGFAAPWHPSNWSTPAPSRERSTMSPSE
jgi:hypothetical protein